MASLPSRTLYVSGRTVDFHTTTADLGAQLRRLLQITEPLQFHSPPGRPIDGILPRPASDPATAFLDDALCRGFAVVVKVPSHVQFGHDHFVLVTGQDGDDYAIADPASDPNDPSTPLETRLSAYGTFQIRGYVEDPVDASALSVSAGSDTALLLVDSLGNRTGQDNSGQVFYEINNSTFFEDDILDEASSTTASAKGSALHVDMPSNGSYTIVASNPIIGIFNVGVSLYSSDGTPQTPVQLSGFGGVQTSFNLRLPPGLASLPPPSRVVSFDSLVAEIAAAARARLIRDFGVAATLDILCRAAERFAKERDHSLSTAILRIVKEILRTSTVLRRIDPTASTLLQQDADALILAL
jgi:hypothetical protein